jgi:phosphate transport system substrate-binding protein
MKRFVFLFLSFNLFVPAAWCLNDTYRIGILLWDDSTQALQTATGFREGLALSGLQHQFDQKIAEGNINRVKSILNGWKEQRFDLIFTVGDRATRFAQQEVKHIPIVFSAVTNPVSDDIVDKWSMPGGNITGTSSWIHTEKKLETFRRAKPRLKTLGVLFNPENAVSTDEVCTMFALAQSQGLQLHSESILDSDHLAESLQKLLDKDIDALWLPEDDLIFNSMKQIGEVATRNKLAVFSSTLKGVENTPDYTAFAQVGLNVNYHKLGHRSVYHAVSILTQGFPPQHLPIETLPAIVVANVNAANAIGYVLPPLFLAYSDRVISGFAGEKLVIGGTGDSQSLLRALAEGLEKNLTQGNVDIPDSIGSTGGIKSILAGRIQLARTARPLRAGEIEQGLKALLFAKSPIVFVVHPSVTGIDNLNSRDIIEIYSGRIIDWREVGAPRNRIYAVSREPGDSSLRIIREHLPEFNDITSPHAKVIYNTPDTVRTLANHRFTLGYVPLSAIQGTDLVTMKLDNIYPSPENIESGLYPLVLPYYIVYRDTPVGLAQAFIDFIFSEDGKRIIESFGAIPVNR